MRSIEELVEQYIEDCRRFPWLSPRHHPTPQGAAKLILGGSDKDVAAEIKAAFEKLSPPPGKKLRRTSR